MIPIVLWAVKTPNEVNAEREWIKQTKISRSDYKVFSDDKTWLNWKENTVATLESHNLQDQIAHPYEVNPDGDNVLDGEGIPTLYKPDDPKLDQVQGTWLYTVFTAILKTPVGKHLIAKFKKEKKPRLLWMELVAHYESAVSTQLNYDPKIFSITSHRYGM